MIPPLYAEQHIRRMRGGAQAHLMRASDGAFYVVKFQNNPQSPRVLANEMIATQVGLRLGLPLPRVEPIEVPDWLIQNTSELCMQVEGAECPVRSKFRSAVISLVGVVLPVSLGFKVDRRRRPQRWRWQRPPGPPAVDCAQCRR